ncbi:MAG TPA: peptidoglycan-associated lipoprotein Pal [Candidatus Polarisedimenticolaceae bacterium]|nr:peptidoglycan-associated lipoprotein Pal [Candidatus Polarisedimenticolaceae bacterium]
MQDKKKWALVICLVLSIVAFSAACKKKQPDQLTDPSATQPSTPTPEPDERAEPPVQVEEPFEQQEPDTEDLDATAQALNAQEVLKTVYFAFDRAELTDTAREILRENANWLKANPKWNVAIEGHCDERGTIEYNLALGQRRANTVRDYLTSLGVPASRIRSVSYGEERPADPGHTEASWAKNRRGVSLVEN